jgi:hypothetical protein
VKLITTVRQLTETELKLLRLSIPKIKKMKKSKLLVSALAIVSIVFVVSCKKEKETAPTSSSASTQSQTIPLQITIQPTVPLGAAGPLAVLAGSAISSTGTTYITGDMGLNPGTSIGGFPPGILIGTQHINDSIATQAKMDLTAAYNDAAGRTAMDIVTIAGNIGGLTLTPGLYKSNSSLEISSGDLTLDAKGNPNAVFIIQIATTLTTNSGRKVFLAGGAQASHIFWQVGSSATFGTTSVFYGTVMTMQSITFNTGATLNGRGLARTGAVVMDSNTIVKE